MYMERIRQNISQWKKIYKEQDDLNNIIQHIRDTSVASRIGARVHEKNGNYFLLCHLTLFIIAF